MLEHALRQMQSGVYERCIYLTSKSTGQLQTIHQLQAMIGTELRFMQMRNRGEHRIVSAGHTCTGDSTCDRGLAQAWFEADIHAPALFADGTLSLARAKALGEQTGVCPYALNRACLPCAEFWIGDSNYVFAPASQGVFQAAVGYDPAKTLLIIDEAHNLPDRAADALSTELASGDLLFALEELRSAGASRRLVNIGSELVRCIDRQPSGPLTTEASYELLDLCEEFQRELTQARFDYSTAAPFAIEIAWRIPELARTLAEPAERFLPWCPQHGLLRSTCLDASTWIRQCLQPFGGSILMSATLSPFDRLRSSCGLTVENSVAAPGHASWREQAYQVAIDCRVDTRSSANSTWQAPHAVSQPWRAQPETPVAVFFSACKYAENVRATSGAGTVPAGRPTDARRRPRRASPIHRAQSADERCPVPHPRLQLRRGRGPARRQVHTAMVVGPALPEVNAVQQARMQATPPSTARPPSMTCTSSGHATHSPGTRAPGAPDNRPASSYMANAMPRPPTAANWLPNTRPTPRSTTSRTW